MITERSSYELDERNASQAKKESVIAVFNIEKA